MTDKTLCEVVIVLDRSGSMASIRDDMEAGLNHFIGKQREFPGRCVVSLYQFDTRYEPIFEERSVDSCPNVVITPRGGTALLDAIGKTVNAVGERFAKLPEEKRPGTVVVMVVTDGHENASSEFKLADVKKLVEHQRNVYQWEFVFLGADLNAFSDGTSMGFHNNVTYSNTPKGAAYMTENMANSVGNYRTARCSVDPNVAAQARLNVDADMRVGVNKASNPSGSGGPTAPVIIV